MNEVTRLKQVNERLAERLRKAESEIDNLLDEIIGLKFNLGQKAGEIGSAEHRGNTVNYIYDKCNLYKKQMGQQQAIIDLAVLYLEKINKRITFENLPLSLSRASLWLEHSKQDAMAALTKIKEAQK